MGPACRVLSNSGGITDEKTFRAVILGSLTLLAGMAFAQQETVSVDEALVIAGLQGDAYEILASELALERTGSDVIQQFAQLMIEDHTATSTRLQELGSGMDMQLEFTASPAQGLMLARLRQLEGDQFDVEYLAQQRMAHKAALVNYSIGAELAENEDLAMFSSETAAAITEHLRLVEDLMANRGITDPYEGFLDAPAAPMQPEQQPEGEQPPEEQPEGEQPEEEQPN